MVDDVLLLAGPLDPPRWVPASTASSSNGRGPLPRRAAGPIPAGRASSSRSIADDPALIDELARRSGPAAPRRRGRPRPRPLRGPGPRPGGPIRLRAPEARPPGADGRAPADLMLGLGYPDFPFERVEAAPRLDEPRLPRASSARCSRCADEHCLFALVPGWRKAVALLLLQRLMRCRRGRDLLPRRVGGGGGGGRDARRAQGRGQVHAGPGPGHARPRLPGRRARLLPARRRASWCPFRRPVGIKPGPRAAAVDGALPRRAATRSATA